MKTIVFRLSLLIIIFSLIGCDEKSSSINKANTDGNYVLNVTLNSNVLKEDDTLILSTFLKYSGIEEEKKIMHTEDYISIMILESTGSKPLMVPDAIARKTILKNGVDDIRYYEISLENFEWSTKEDVSLLVTAYFEDSESKTFIIDVEVPLVIK